MSRLTKFYIFLSVIFSITFMAVLGIQVASFFTLSDLQSTYAESKFRIEKIVESDNNLSSLKTKYEAIEDEIPKIDTALPDEKDSSILISDLDSLAQSSGLKFTMIQTNTSGKRTTSSSDPSLLQTIKGKYGYEMPLEIKVEGSFVAFASFIDRIENYQRLLNITAIEISKITVSGEKTDTIEAKVKLTAYLKR